MNNSFFIKSYFKSGDKFIKDLMEDEGKFVSLVSLRNSNVNVNTNFLEYMGLTEAIFDGLKWFLKGR